jgi:hypothetical protein
MPFLSRKSGAFSFGILSPFIILQLYMTITIKTMGSVSGAVAAVPGVTHPASASALVVSEFEPRPPLSGQKRHSSKERKIIKNLEGAFAVGMDDIALCIDKFTVMFYYPYQRKIKNIYKSMVFICPLHRFYNVHVQSYDFHLQTGEA